MREALLAAWRPARGTLAKDGLRGPACRSSRWSGLRAWGGFRPGRRRRAQRGFWPAARRPCPQPPAACASWALAARKGAGSGASAGQAEGCRRPCTGPLPGTCALRSLAAGKTGWEGDVAASGPLPHAVLASQRPHAVVREARRDSGTWSASWPFLARAVGERSAVAAAGALGAPEAQSRQARDSRVRPPTPGPPGGAAACSQPAPAKTATAAWDRVLGVLVQPCRWVADRFLRWKIPNAYKNKRADPRMARWPRPAVAVPSQGPCARLSPVALSAAWAQLSPSHTCLNG